jgi:hypothetical protein
MEMFFFTFTWPVSISFSFLLGIRGQINVMSINILCFQYKDENGYLLFHLLYSDMITNH